MEVVDAYLEEEGLLGQLALLAVRQVLADGRVVLQLMGGQSAGVHLPAGTAP